MSIDQSEMKALIDGFIVEAKELLEGMEDALLLLEQGGHSEDVINAVFRAAHTIKGSSGLFGFDHIVRFTHVVENVLVRLREGAIEVTPELVNALLPCKDHIAAQVEAIAAGKTAEPPELAAKADGLHAALEPFLDAATLHKKPAAAAEKQWEDLSPRNTGVWHLSLRFTPDCLRNGMDPFSFVRYLQKLGEIVNLTTLAHSMPAADAMDPETCYIGFEIDLRSSAHKEEIERVFEFVRDGSTIHILPPNSRLNDYMNVIRSLPAESTHIGELLVASGAITRKELEAGLASQQQQKDANQPARRIGDILVDQKAVQRPLVDAAAETQKQDSAKRKEAQSIRVDASRLDRLVDLLGQLVIAGAGASLRATRIGDAQLMESVGEVMSMLEEVRESALQLRMVPIGATFSRFQRVVRDVSAELGKGIDLVVSGGETEVDKSVAEKIADPLMHLVRNSMDHGIESAEVRASRGKSPRGQVRLASRHEAGSIIIEVSDDGGGLNRARILAKAVEKGLVKPDASLSDEEIFALIFEAGFSTAQTISNISGRGVGMDVVKKNVSALRGTIEITSTEGVGSTFKIRLPLTLAIIDGFLVDVGGSSFVIPLDRVLECVEMPSQHTNNGYMDLRGELLPFIHLRNVYKVAGQRSPRENVVVVQTATGKAGIVVDKLLGEFQTVVKPLGKLFTHVQGLGGSTILGSGEVALIIDVPTLAHFTLTREHRAVAARATAAAQLQM